MAVDYDMWKLDRLAPAFEDYIIQSTDIDVSHLIRDSITRFINLRDNSRDEQKYESKSILILLIFGSLFQDIPLDLLHSALRQIFKSKDSSNNWTTVCVSPLSWSIKDRLFYLGILLGRTMIDSNSSVNQSGIKFGISSQDIKILQSLIPLLIQVSYPCTLLDFERDAFNFDSLNFDENIASSHIFRSKLSIIQLETISKLHLHILQLITYPFCTSVVFLHHFPKIYGVFQSCKTIFLQNIKTELIPKGYNKENWESLLYDNEEISSLLNWKEIPNGMTIAAKICELKLRLNIAIQAVIDQIHLEDFTSIP
jgi:hypothetical protein